ncbi:flagellar hook-length control protein FliK [Methylorubrum extorquens]|uniref:flagellar hook-length control protein FliK n=1 Tax=Methylorubrum extorquens TaxID=408 RepID=UPI000972E25D|nr:flagellar hook-length control protein FliK [Methylorubrum extorquens]APX84079.1 flagellar hook-length control protein FliK [Methylorubrum extorquens]
MRSLDTLPLLRPKSEAGRAPSGEDARAGVPPDFEAMLGAFENGAAERGTADIGTARAGEAAVDQSEAGTDMPPTLPAEALTATTLDVGGSALQALMALTGPAAPAIAVPPDASLEAMVQRAAARAGSGPGPAPAEPALQMSMVGLETHFAPVRPHGAAPTDTVNEPSLNAPSAPPMPPTSGSIGAAPAAPVSPEKALLPGAPRTTPASDATVPSALPAGGPDGPLAPGSVALQPPASRSDARDPAVPSDRPAPDAPANGLTTPAAMTSARPASPVPGPDRPAESAPASPAPAPDEAVRQTAGAPPAQAVGAEAPRSPASRGRAAPRSDHAEPVGAADNSALFDQPESTSLPEPTTITQPGTPGQTRRDPESRQDRPTAIARPDTMPEHAAVAVPRPQAEGGARAERAGSDAVTIEAPRPDMPLAPSGPQETAGLPTPAPASPLRQIVDAVAAQLPAAPAAMATPSARPVPASTEAGPLKILTLQLHPADLGSVLVRMRLQDGRLEMSLRTSREETAERLRKEGDLLAGLLREAGYEPEAVTIQSGGPGAGEAGPRGQGFASFAGSQSGQHDRQPGAATPDQSGRRPSPRADAAATPTEEQDHETDSRGRDRGSLYL